MPGQLYRGKDVVVYITTEDPTYGISKTGGGDLSADNSSPDFIAERGASLAAATRLTNVVGLSFEPTRDKETIEYLGRNLDDYITNRDKAEITINLLQLDHAWAALHRNADGGIDGTALNELDEIKEATHGYRIFIQVRGSELVYTFRNCCIRNHKSVVGANKTNQDQITFDSSLWEVGTDGYFTATSESEL
jgi:hypothetical protein